MESKGGNMLSTSSDLLHIAIAIAVVVVGGYLSYLLYNLGNLAKESKKSVERVNTQLDKVDAVIDEVIPTIQGINRSVRQVQEALSSPLNSLLGIFKRFTHLNDED